MSKFVYIPELQSSINLDNVDEIKIDDVDIEDHPKLVYVSFRRYNEDGSAITIKQVAFNGDYRLNDAEDFVKILSDHYELEISKISSYGTVRTESL